MSDEPEVVKEKVPSDGAPVKKSSDAVGPQGLPGAPPDDGQSAPEGGEKTVDEV